MDASSSEAGEASSSEEDELGAASQWVWKLGEGWEELVEDGGASG